MTGRPFVYFHEDRRLSPRARDVILAGLNWIGIGGVLSHDEVLGIPWAFLEERLRMLDGLDRSTFREIRRWHWFAYVDRTWKGEQ